MAVRARAIAPIVCVLAAGCADEYEPPPIVWQGEHLRFGTDEDIGELCAGTLPYADQLVEYLGDTLGREGARVDYYWVSDLEGTPCPPDTRACAPGSKVFALEPFYQHELVHAVGGVAYDGYHTGIEEGVAMAFGDDDSWPLYRHDELIPMLETHDDAQRLEDVYYPLAGHFISFLRKYQGDAQVAELWRTSRHHPVRWPAVRNRIEEIFEADFDEIVAEYYESYPNCGLSRYRDNGLECAQDPLIVPTDGSKLSAMVDLGCAQEHVRGPRFGARWTTVAFELTSAGYYGLRVRKLGGREPGSVWVRKCGQSCFDERFSTFDLDTLVEVDSASDSEAVSHFRCAQAGKYRIRLLVPADDEAQFHLELWRGDTDPSPCAE